MRRPVLLFLVALSVAGLVLPAANSSPGSSLAASRAAWASLGEVVPGGPDRLVDPLAGHVLSLDTAALRGVLDAAPAEGGGSGLEIALPTPDGGTERFAVVAAPVMEPDLARRHPQIRTYTGRGLDDPAATLRLSLTPLGVHASVLGDGRAWYLDPQMRGDRTMHVAYTRDTLPLPADPHDKAAPVVVAGDAHRAQHGTDSAGRDTNVKRDSKKRGGITVPLRVYRLALVTDPSYARFWADAANVDLADERRVDSVVTAAKAVLVHRINQLYEADLRTRMLLVAATERTNLNTDAEMTGPNGPCGGDPCFSAEQATGCSSATLAANVVVAGLTVGARNFDIGHVAFGLAGGGIAALGVVGDSGKARGCTGVPRPQGDFFAVDYVAHEMGHQFGAHHSFNGNQGSCSATNRNVSGTTAVEPGSGSSVMAYAGICTVDDLQAHTDPYFSHVSLDQMEAYTENEADLSSTQFVALRGFDGSDSYLLRYDGRASARVTRNVNHDAAGIQAAISGVLPEGGQVIVSGVTDRGFTVAFGGTLADTANVVLLKIAPQGAPAVVGETVAGGTTRRAGTQVASDNRAPSVTAPETVQVPVQTPFKLTAKGHDPDGDRLTYLWEQADGSIPALGSALGEPVRVLGPLFRQFGIAARYARPNDAYLSPSPGQNIATSNPSRSFPDAAQVARGNTNAATGLCPPALASSEAFIDCHSELLPTAAFLGTARDGVLSFRVTVRDSVPGAGGTATSRTLVRVVRNAGPFRVLDLPAGLPSTLSTLPVAWDVAGTDRLLGVARVRVLLSTDGGLTFPHVLAEATPNDGSAVLALPAGLSTTQGRVKVEAVDGVFYAISPRDLLLTS